MSFADRQANEAFPTTAADATGVSGVMRITGITTAASVQLPNALRGKRIEVRASGADVQVGLSFGSAGLTLTVSPGSAPGTGSAASGMTIAAGTSRIGRVPQGPGASNLYLNYVAVSGTGVLELFCLDSVKP